MSSSAIMASFACAAHASMSSVLHDASNASRDIAAFCAGWWRGYAATAAVVSRQRCAAAAPALENSCAAAGRTAPAPVRFSYTPAHSYGAAPLYRTPRGLLDLFTRGLGPERHGNIDGHQDAAQSTRPLQSTNTHGVFTSTDGLPPTGDCGAGPAAVG